MPNYHLTTPHPKVVPQCGNVFGRLISVTFILVVKTYLEFISVYCKLTFI